MIELAVSHQRVVDAKHGPRFAGEGGELRRSRGQSLVEFAIVLPFFILLLMALIDSGRMLFTYISMTNATREMARLAAFSGTSPPYTNAHVVTAFQGHFMVLGGVSSSTDSVIVTVANDAGTQVGTATCPMPVQLSSCTANPGGPGTLPDRSNASGGYVQIDATHRFEFTPVFQAFLNALGGNAQAVFNLTTTTRRYIE